MKKIHSLFGVLTCMMAFCALMLSAPAEARSRDGYSNWSEVGAATMRDFQNGKVEYQEWARSEALSKLNLSPYEVREVLDAMQKGTAERGVIRKGDTFKSMSYYSKKQGKVIMLRKVRLTAAGEYEVSRARLKNGRVIVIVDKCNNVGEEEVPPPAPKPPVVPEVIKIPVPPVTIIPPATIPPVVPTPEADKFCDNIRINAVAGVELELADGWARSVYGAWGIYCMKRLKNGNQIGFGPAGQMAVYGGDPGNGHFKGHFIAAGVGMMYVDKKGQDVEAKLMVGEYKSDYRNDDGYRMRERHPMLALSVAHNDYRGVIKGTGKERQIFGMLGFPIGGSATEAWPGYEGKASELNLYYNAGVRQFLNKENTLYVQAGILGELRSGEDYFSCSLRVGYANKSKTFGVHAGVNACDGGIAPAIGAWVDFGQMIRKGRAKKRAAAIAPDLGNVGQPTTEVALVSLASTLD